MMDEVGVDVAIYLSDKLIMLHRLATITNPILLRSFRQPFSSTHHHDHTHDTVLVTRHNPNAEKDLRGFEHL